jgi:anti-sigma factor RsiW
MSDQWTERLSEYLDGDLAEGERVALEAHLATCQACTDTLAGLRRVVMRARALEDQPPAKDLWAGVASRIGAAPEPAVRPLRAGPRRFTFSLPQLLAAGIALAVLSGGGVWMLQTGPAGVPGPTVAVRPGEAPITQVAAPTVAAPGYDNAVGDLQRILNENRGRLDTATVRVLEQNLALIDQAIAQARRALAADPANAYLNSHLAETMRRKIDLLRQAASLASAVS